jgi:hypothetical protein
MQQIQTVDVSQLAQVTPDNIYVGMPVIVLHPDDGSYMEGVIDGEDFEFYKKSWEDCTDLIDMAVWVGPTADPDNSVNYEFALSHLRVKPDTTDAQKEYILCAAVWWDDGINTYVHQPINVKTGFVVTGRRHHNCFTTKAMLAGINAFKNLKPIQGFLTNTNRFVDRIEASVIAYHAKQIESMVPELKSEDLY